MYTFKELRKAVKLKIDGPYRRVVVMGNCATQFISTAIEGYAKLSGINMEVYDTDYNQIDAQLLDSRSEVYSFTPEEIIIWIATDKIYEEFLDMTIDQRMGFAEQYISKIVHYWELIRQNTKARVLQFNFSEIDDMVLGQYSCKVESTFIYQIRKLNYLLQEAMSKQADIFPVDLLALQSRIGRDKLYDAPLYYNAKMTVATNALPYIAKDIIDIINAMSGKIKKCVVLDLDNTLWGGVIGDDGINNIEIGELGKGHVYTNLQRWLKELKEYGIILAVCSKNNEEIAKEPFEKHEEMVLRLSDISIFVANWNDKAANIKIIQSALNIGMDSMIFIDDNPFERNLVKQLIPEIEVPEMPEDPAQYLDFLQNCNFFETVSYTGKNEDRTKQYQAEFERKKLEQSFDSIDDYLKSLQMIGEAKAFDESKYSRIAQLTQRSNQFNLRTIRYTEEDIKRIAEDDGYITLYFMLKDKYGDHGLVSVVVLKKISNQEAFIDTWLMSCRVLKRGMEEYVMNNILEKAGEQGISIITAEYIPTPKNAMVKGIYKEMGFEESEKDHYRIEVCNYKKKDVFITEEE